MFVHGVHFSRTGGGSILCEHMGSASLLWKGMEKVFYLDVNQWCAHVYDQLQ